MAQGTYLVSRNRARGSEVDFAQIPDGLETYSKWLIARAFETEGPRVLEAELDEAVSATADVVTRRARLAKARAERLEAWGPQVGIRVAS